MSHDHPPADSFCFKEDRHTAAFTCKHVWTDGEPILFVSHDEDGEWQFLCGRDHDDAAAADCLLVCLEHVVHRDPSVNDLAAMCAAHVATRSRPGARWTIEDETPGHIRRVIEQYGWWVGLVHGEGDAPAFAYTIGLHEKLGHPEIILFGLPPKSMHRILNRCGQMIRGGQRFVAGASVAEVLEGYDVRFRAIAAEATYAEYLGYACRHYGSRAFPVLQLVWPDKEHRFPGDPGAADFLAGCQPLLA